LSNLFFVAAPWPHLFFFTFPPLSHNDPGTEGSFFPPPFFSDFLSFFATLLLWQTFFCNLCGPFSRVTDFFFGNSPQPVKAKKECWDLFFPPLVFPPLTGPSNRSWSPLRLFLRGMLSFSILSGKSAFFSAAGHFRIAFVRKNLLPFSDFSLFPDTWLFDSHVLSGHFFFFSRGARFFFFFGNSFPFPEIPPGPLPIFLWGPGNFFPRVPPFFDAAISRTLFPFVFQFPFWCGCFFFRSEGRLVWRCRGPFSFEDVFFFFPIFLPPKSHGFSENQFSPLRLRFELFFFSFFPFFPLERFFFLPFLLFSQGLFR